MMTKAATPYTAQFYDQHRDWSLQSAKQVVPVITDLVRPQSVVDIGCGDGTWLKIFSDAGIGKILGVDGDYVDTETLQIQPSEFMAHDLKLPFSLSDKPEYDIVVSLEVAEHLPPDCARNFIQSLVSLGPVVLFSAAAPNQGGTDHLNEQWPDYWAELFSEHRYDAVNCLRPRLWRNDSIKWWYRQNMVLFVKHGYQAQTDTFQREINGADQSMLSVVHPEALSFKQQQLENLRYANENPPLRKTITAIPRGLKKALVRRLSRA